MAKKTKTARKLKLGAWPKTEVQLLRKIFPAMPTSQIANKLGRPLQAVKKKASRLGLKKAKSYLRKIRRAG